MKDQRFLFRILIAAAVLYELLLIIFLLMNFNGNIPLYMFIYFEGFLLFLLGWYVAGKYEPYPRPEKLHQKELSKYFFAEEGKYHLIRIPLFIILTGILFRLTLIPSNPATSEDAFRYLWEGKMNVYGYNPYTVAPDDPRLQRIYEENLPVKANFLHLTSIYPPFAQMIFTAGYIISGDSTAGLKFIFLLCEILTLIFLLRILIARGLHPWLVVMYAWLPLPLMEYFVNAHIDAAGIMFLVLFIYFLEKNKIICSAFAFSFAVLIKFLPLMLLPVIYRHFGLKKTIVMTGILSLISLLLYLPFMGEGLSLFNHLLKYLERWEFNGSVYRVVKLFSNGYVSRIICNILFLIAMGVITLKEKELLRSIFYVFIVYFVFTSTLYPWYLGWAAVLNPFFNFYSLLSLFFTINFSNFTPLASVWTEYTIVLLAEYIPFFILLVFDLRQRRAQSRALS